MFQHLKGTFPDDLNILIRRVTGITAPRRLGLQKLGAKFTPDVPTLHGFVFPDFGPARHDFWHTAGSELPTEKLLVTRIESPSVFWIQNIKEKTKFDDLIKGMTDWYNEYRVGSHKLKKDQVVLGGFYAAYWELYQEWYRVRVIDIVLGSKDPSFVAQVLDFGSTIVVGLDSIFPLREIYNELPIQAVQAEVYDESPTAGIYTVVEKNKFWEMALTGKAIDMMVLSERDEPDDVFPIIRVILLTKPIHWSLSYESIFDCFYTLDGRLKFHELYRKFMGIRKSETEK